MLASALLLALGGMRPAEGQSVLPSPLIDHQFNDSNQGWGLTTDTGIADAAFLPSGGNPGGCIGGTDEAIGETWYFRSPPSVLERLPAAENGSIAFSLRQSTNTEGGFLDDDVVIISKAGRLGFRFGRGSAPGTAWKRFSVRLTASDGWKWNGGGPATQEQMRAVLAAPLSLEIRGEYVTGHDEGFLDGFELRAAE